jgi:chromosome segregation protein
VGIRPPFPRRSGQHGSAKVHFKKLRVHGFKSFVDPVEMNIDPGITGIVGPNGCGKSNVVEALRWAMGEASAKRMRGGEMDDVIFGGAAGRAQRNNAEVTIHLDNTDRTAPAAFNDAEELEITRRIDRGQGSNYKINGKDVRARDVQLLFADLASGANSTAIVSQGRIGALIGAKPTDRRTLLEEAAGIRGLHSRRHEAELRLRAAETNLERLEDVIGALESQMTALQRQARQAVRYRKIAEQLRAQEAILLHLRWTDTEAALEAARAGLREAEAEVAEKTGAAATAARLQTDAQESLPRLREAEAAAAAKLQSQVIAERQLQAEAARVAEALEALETRLSQIAADAVREDSLAVDAAEALTRLAAEKQTLAGAQASEKIDADRARKERDDIDGQVAEKETALDELNEQAAATEAQRAGLNRQIAEARSRLDGLARRAEEIATESETLRARIAEAGDVETARAAVDAAEAALTAARADAEDAEARRAADDAAVAEARDVLSKAEAALRSELDAARDAARAAVSEAENRAREALSAAERAARDGVAAAEQSGRAAVQEADRKRGELAAEVSALTKLLAQDEDDAEPVLERLDVNRGFETALGAALGDDLDAALDDGAARHWIDLGALPDGAPNLPAGAAPLSDYVAAPPALARRLSQIGVVEDASKAEALQGGLTVGQRLVSRDGGLWRWDGLRIRPGTATAAAKRLEQRNRLTAASAALTEADAAHEAARAKAAADLEEAKAAAESAVASARQGADGALAKARADAEAAVARAEADAEGRLDGARSTLEAALAKFTQAGATAQAARTARDESYDAASAARDTLADLERTIAEDRSRLESLAEAKARVEEEVAEATDRVSAAEQALGVLEDAEVLRDRLTRTRTALAELRAKQVEKRAAFERIERDARARGERLTAIEAEAESWTRRAEGASSRMADLTARRQAAEEEKAALTARPAEIAEKRAALVDTIAICEAERNAAAETLAEAENAQRETDRALKAAEQALAEARETRVRRDAAVEQAMQASATVAERIQEKLECRPEEALAQSGLAEDADLPLSDDVERRIERLSRERDNIGAVNLRAEQEVTELDEQIASMRAERDDLIAAINRLRQGIGALNREGRERLLRAFEEVDEHFRELFEKLFGGGEAHLKLTESEDPLQAGLEIFASPPGKKMQVLSLLSGGEQALTALALLFGVFLTNPAPICVLDEVDAPLDDTNVDRFCQMLDHISGSGSTRFLVVTHHRMTMARVDRLFGVTMAERGVSQLVSVDLNQAERMREAG